MNHSLLRRTLSGHLSVLALGAAFAGHANAADAQPVQHGVSEVTRAWVESVESADIDTVIRMHPKAMTGFPATDNQVDGLAMVEAYRGMFAKYRAHATIQDGRYLRTGNLMVSWGLFVLELKPRDGGETIVVKGRFSDMARKTPTGWQYLVDHASVLPKLP